MNENLFAIFRRPERSNLSGWYYSTKKLDKRDKDNPRCTTGRRQLKGSDSR